MTRPDPSAPQPPEATRWQAIARGILALAFLFLGVWTLREFIPALVWATILAIAVWPLYERANRRFPPGRHHILLPTGFTLAITLVFLIPLAFAGVQLAREVHSGMVWVNEARHHGIPPPAWLATLPMGSGRATAWWNANLASPDAASDLLSRAGNGDVLATTRHYGSQLLHRIVLFGFTLLTLFFLFRDGHHLTEQMRRASHRMFGPRGERVGRQIVASVHGTVDGLVLVGLGVGALLGVSYAMFGVPHPVLLGALTALAAMIPFGAPLLFGIAALLLLVQGSTVGAIVVFSLGMVVTFIADHFVRPALIGGATKLPFLWVLLGILGGVTTWGLLGLFLGPAIMAALMSIWRDWAEPAPAPAARPAAATAHPPAA